jgi:predicted HicB family RNase H-like nuclease
MAKGEDVVWVQLATRIPKELHRRIKQHCVQTETAVMEFVETALREMLAKDAGGKRLARGE